MYQAKRDPNPNDDSRSDQASFANQRVISGGKYGCALLVKRTGTGTLPTQSLGRLCSLIKKALNDQLIVHYKTFIVKKESPPKIDPGALQQKIERIQSDVVAILQEQGGSVTLA
jgi:hypothetical protein